MLKRLSLTCSAILAFGGSALAADIPVKAPVLKAPEAAAMSWTGFYLNGGFGYGLWTAETTVVVPGGVCVLCENQIQGGKGWLGVVGIGYDRQLTSKIVGGVFADFNLSSLT